MFFIIYFDFSSLPSTTNILQILRGAIVVTISTSSKTIQVNNMEDGRWHHMVVTWNAIGGQSQTGELRVYIDNTLLDTVANFGTGMQMNT